MDHSKWFTHKDFACASKHDIVCTLGACWPSSTQWFISESGLTKEEVIRKTEKLISDDMRNHICEITHWVLQGYSYKAWKTEDNKSMLFIRGGGDHALVFSSGKFRFHQQIQNVTW